MLSKINSGFRIPRLFRNKIPHLDSRGINFSVPILMNTSQSLGISICSVWKWNWTDMEWKNLRNSPAFDFQSNLRVGINGKLGGFYLLLASGWSVYVCLCAHMRMHVHMHECGCMHCEAANPVQGIKESPSQQGSRWLKVCLSVVSIHWVLALCRTLREEWSVCSQGAWLVETVMFVPCAEKKLPEAC